MQSFTTLENVHRYIGVERGGGGGGLTFQQKESRRDDQHQWGVRSDQVDHPPPGT